MKLRDSILCSEKSNYTKSIVELYDRDALYEYQLKASLRAAAEIRTVHAGAARSGVHPARDPACMLALRCAIRCARSSHVYEDEYN